MQKRINLKVFFEKAKHIDFRNLFYPVIPAIDLTGKLAQVLSALTQGVTIWFICQSKLHSLSSWVSIPLTIAAIILICAAIEIGGRKGAQVVTRQAIWKKFGNVWYWVLGVPILLVTAGLFYLSYDLSTKGVDKTFQQSVKTAMLFDDSDLVERHDNNIDRIDKKFDKQISTLTTAYTANYSAKESEFNSKIVAVQSKVDKHTRNAANGVKWAKSHRDKQTGIRDGLTIEKQTALAGLTVDHNTTIKGIELNRASELSAANELHLVAVNEAKTALNANHTNDKEVAAFWGNLFSNLVGIMIIVALVCIVIVEIFRKGAGIEISYKESELPPSAWGIIWQGVKNRGFNLSYNLVKKIYVDRREFDFDFMASPTLPATTDNYFPSERKRDLHALFNIENTSFSKNAKTGNYQTETIDLDTTSSENNISAIVENPTVLDAQYTHVKNAKTETEIPNGKTCLNCGKEINFGNSRRKYCSDNCRQEFWEKTNDKKIKKGRVQK